MRVEQLMKRPVYVCEPHHDLNVPAQIMWDEDCGAVPVCDLDEAGHMYPFGMITDRDVAMAAYTQGKPLRDITVRAAMSHDLVTCRPSDPVSVAVTIMRTNRLHRLPVVDVGGQLVGMLSLSDIARCSDASGREHVPGELVAEALHDITVPRRPHDLSPPLPQHI
jgi:CBS domain-containing protein